MNSLSSDNKQPISSSGLLFDSPQSRPHPLPGGQEAEHVRAFLVSKCWLAGQTVCVHQQLIQHKQVICQDHAENFPSVKRFGEWAGKPAPFSSQGQSCQTWRPSLSPLPFCGICLEVANGLQSQVKAMIACQTGDPTV